MKSIIKTILGLAAALIAAAACDVENVGAIYSPADNNNNVTFTQSVVVSDNILATADVVEIEIARSVANGSVTVSLASTMPAEVVVPSSVTFADGEYTAKIAINVSGTEVGKKYTGTISIANKSDYVDGAAISSVSVTLAKAYTWVSLGDCYFYDSFLFEDIIKVELQKAEGFELYKILNPYPKNAVPFEAQEPISSFSYTLGADGSISWGSVLNIGYYYAEAGSSYVYYSPDEIGEDGQKENRMVANGTIAQFCWYPYLPDIGSWWGISSYAWLSMPEVSEEDFYHFLNQ